ncbi:bacteriohemerythrin [Pinisolibacter aquiterrae]|uniref:bacteriohemerythrin n=1 Tax=Pinisolibacter aquiterrae TaxID=2815579 RepID=UPI001C3D78C8|nr:bacteriohemerythrin [Pinisolibacter aquiterrae]MCC8234985.1 bacteriohemerythrin [Pinisolibacter aquiterrae]
MQFFYWNASFEIGIPLIDAQHRRLVDLINDLATAITEGGRLPEVGALLQELRDYSAKHFADEEGIMDTTLLSEGEKARHRRAHTGFVKKVEEIARRDDLLSTDVSEQVLEFLITWLVSHILGSDRKISRALASPAAPEEAGGAVPSVEQVLINALGETERRFRLISDYTPAMIWVCDPAGSRSYVNRSWSSFVGADAPHDDGSGHVHPEDRTAYRARIRRLLEQPTSDEIEYRLRKADGSHGWVLERILPRWDSGQVFMGLIASAIDITAIKKSEEILSRANRELEEEVARRTAELERLMLTDPLTGIGNRRRLIEHIAGAVERACRSGRPLTAVFLDLDHFKRVNDAYGHPIGDRLLARVAGTLRANLRSCDVVCRYGGEEFVVVLEETSLLDALRTAERLRTAIARIRLREMDAAVSVSAGIAQWEPGQSIDGFLAQADKALYRAKADGRDRCVATTAL